MASTHHPTSLQYIAHIAMTWQGWLVDWVKLAPKWHGLMYSYMVYGIYLHWYWLVVTGTMNGLWLSRNSWEWNAIIPSDFHSIIFQTGRSSTKQYIYIYRLYQPYMNHIWTIYEPYIKHPLTTINQCAGKCLLNGIIHKLNKSSPVGQNRLRQGWDEDPCHHAGGR